MHQEWNFKSGTEHLCIGTPSLHHSCLYIWLSSSNWVICPSGNLPERLFLPPNHSDISFSFYWFVSQRVKQSQMHINPKSLSLELTLLASRRLNTWETLSFFCSSHIRADTIMRSLQRSVPEGLLCIFSFFFGCTSAETLVGRLQPWSVPRGNGWGLGLELFKALGPGLAVPMVESFHILQPLPSHSMRPRYFCGLWFSCTNDERRRRDGEIEKIKHLCEKKK